MNNDTSDVWRHQPRRSNAHLQSGVERVEQDGREYLVFPIIAVREMVLNYPEHGTKELLPADHLRDTVHMWAGTKLTFVHPENHQKTANKPNSYTGEVIGEAHTPEMVGNKLRVNGWVDIEKANSIGGLAAEVVDQLESGMELAVSAGYATIDDRRVNGTHEGESYDVVQGKPIPDHIAIFPSDAFQARCSPEDGCGAPRVNTTNGTMSENITDDQARTFGWKVLSALGISTNTQPECECDDPTECTCTNRENASGDEEEEPGDEAEEEEEESADSGESDDGTTDTDTMSDSDIDIDALAERSAFSKEALEAWDDDELSALEATVEIQEQQSSDESTEEETESTESTEDDVDTVPEDEFDELKQNYETLQETVKELAEQKETEAKREDARIVANALGIDEEQALSMDEETLSDLAESHGTQNRANYGAVPGQVDRTPDDSEVEKYPAGTRSAYDARKED